MSIFDGGSLNSNSIHPDTSIGAVHLTVSDLERSLKYYTESLGFQIHTQSGKHAKLGAGDDNLLLLTQLAGARPVSGTSGLYHFAVLVPSRAALAGLLQNLIKTQTPVQGFAEHLVSEAIYLADPDGNGIEIYRDRPREKWYGPDGEQLMATEPLDVDGVLGELADPNQTWAGLPESTRIGHIHLQVADIPQAEDFYERVLGFDLLMRYGPAAAFLSAGGYHHHVGVNTWAGVGAPPAPPDAVGLRWFTIKIPDSASMQAVRDRLNAENLAVEALDDGLFVRDPSGIGILLKTG
jgi:catechol 2,3-dioxygenase